MSNSALRSAKSSRRGRASIDGKPPDLGAQQQRGANFLNFSSSLAHPSHRFQLAPNSGLQRRRMPIGGYAGRSSQNNAIATEPRTSRAYFLDGGQGPHLLPYNRFMAPEPPGPSDIPPGLPDLTWEHLTITLENGQVLTGWYGYSERLVTVITPRGGSRTSAFGFLPPVVMARILLRQLAEDGLD
jgi:hypothetical protein